MDTKFGRVVTYLKGILLTKSPLERLVTYLEVIVLIKSLGSLVL